MTDGFLNPCNPVSIEKSDLDQCQDILNDIERKMKEDLAILDDPAAISEVSIKSSIFDDFMHFGESCE
jgi:hypothetical protein